MRITQLGYIGVAASQVDAWRTFAAGFLGMQVVDCGERGLALRMDARRQRMLIEAADHDGLAFFGLEVADREELQDTTAAILAAGVCVFPGDVADRKARHVDDFLWFHDPDGNRVELYCGPASAEQPFAPARPIGGFRTGDLGVGHVVVQTNNFAAMEDFYQGILKFRLSDFVEASPFRASFLHVNPRHHSFAIIESTEHRLHHVMVEYCYVDDVGRLYDMALADPGRVAVTLGRHSNDHILSFYSNTPGGFMIETGWAGRLIDECTWKPGALYGPSIWGHERSWLSPEAQAAARKLRDAAAERGVVEPTEVVRSPGFNLGGLNK